MRTTILVLQIYLLAAAFQPVEGEHYPKDASICAHSQSSLTLTCEDDEVLRIHNATYAYLPLYKSCSSTSSVVQYIKTIVRNECKKVVTFTRCDGELVCTIRGAERKLQNCWEEVTSSYRDTTNTVYISYSCVKVQKVNSTVVVKYSVEDSTTEREEDSTTEREEDSTTEREEDSTTEREEDSTTEREDDSTTERKKDLTTEREEDNSNASKGIIPGVVGGIVGISVTVVVLVVLWTKRKRNGTTKDRNASVPVTSAQMYVTPIFDPAADPDTNVRDNIQGNIYTDVEGEYDYIRDNIHDIQHQNASAPASIETVPDYLVPLTSAKMYRIPISDHAAEPDNTNRDQVDDVTYSNVEGEEYDYVTDIENAWGGNTNNG